MHGPMKLSIRQNNEDGLIRAYFALTESRDPEREGVCIATLNMACADKDRKLFDDWKDALAAFANRETERLCGVPVTHNEEFRPGDLN